MFSLKVTFPGEDRARTLIWNDGKIGGDEDALDLIETVARVHEGRAVALPGGPVTFSDHLASPFSLIALANRTFSKIEAEGDVPSMEPGNVIL